MRAYFVFILVLLVSNAFTEEKGEAILKKYLNSVAVFHGDYKGEITDIGNNNEILKQKNPNTLFWPYLWGLKSKLNTDYDEPIAWLLIF